MRCSYALHETGIQFRIVMKTKNADNMVVNYEEIPDDRHYVEFRTPRGVYVRREAQYDAVAGRVSYDLNASHDDLLTETGPWEYRGVLVRNDGMVIKSAPSARFWVVP